MRRDIFHRRQSSPADVIRNYCSSRRYLFAKYQRKAHPRRWFSREIPTRPVSRGWPQTGCYYLRSWWFAVLAVFPGKFSRHIDPYSFNPIRVHHVKRGTFYSSLFPIFFPFFFFPSIYTKPFPEVFTEKSVAFSAIQSSGFEEWSNVHRQSTHSL